MKKAYIYIGQPKSASTTLCFSVINNREQFEKDTGFYVPTSLGVDHSTVFTKPDLFDSLLGEVRGKDNIFLLSSNFFWFNEEKVNSFAEGLKADGYELNIIFVYRHPQSTIASLFQERLKHGSTVAQIIEWQSAVLEYDVHLKPWMDVADVWTPLDFEELRKGDDLFQSFISAVGLETPIKEIRYNEGLPLMAVQLLAFLNTTSATMDDLTMPQRGVVVSFLNRLTGDKFSSDDGLIANFSKTIEKQARFLSEDCNLPVECNS